MDAISRLLTSVAEWAASQSDVRAVALVGSHARGTAGSDSDVDLVVVVDDLVRRLHDQTWVAHFGDAASVTHEDWGLVQSLRVTYADGREVEFGLTTAGWAEPPLEAGTVRVIRDGLRVVFDPDGLLGGAIDAATLTTEPVGRRSAKVILVDPVDRVLLFRGQDPSAPDQGAFWFPPGGGVGEKEDLHEAARREVLEEVGLDLSGRALGPVVLRRDVSFSFEGVPYQQEEAYFVVRVDRVEVDPAGWTDQERRAIADHRWWPVRDLIATDETIYPEGLGELLLGNL